MYSTHRRIYHIARSYSKKTSGDGDYMSVLTVFLKSIFLLPHKKSNYYNITRPPELVREFIHDCLYHPVEGYFSKSVPIFSHAMSCRDPAKDASSDDIEFHKLKGEDEYNRRIKDLYLQHISSIMETTPVPLSFLQLWHTPAVIFRPWYGYAIAKYTINDFIKKKKKETKLKIYEIGPGNGYLCVSVLDYIQKNHPEIYSTMEYHLIEISHLLHAHQKNLIIFLDKHTNVVQFHHQSIFDWDTYEKDPAYIYAFEVMDNLPHDRIKYDERSGELLQAKIYTNEKASLAQSELVYREVYEPVTDPLIIEYMNVMGRLGYISPSLKWSWRRAMASFREVKKLFLNDEPFDPYSSEFIPTTAYKLIKKLKNYFPRHSIVLSDFYELMDTIPGHTAPLVQTRFTATATNTTRQSQSYGETVQCTTYLLKRGLFDIFFPTQFEVLKKLYASVMEKPQDEVCIQNHPEFMRAWADVEKTRTQSGFNPLLEEYCNVKLLLS